MKKLFFTSLATLILCANVAFARVGLLQFAASSPIPNFTLNGGLPHWQAARNAIKNGTAAQNYKVVILGESQQTGRGCLFNGNGAGANTKSNEHSCAGANLIANMLRMYGINAQTNSVSGEQNITVTNSYTLFDTRVTNGSAWGPCTGGGCGFTFGGLNWIPNTNSGAFTFNPTNTTNAYPAAPPINTDTLEVWSLSLGGDALPVQVGGSTICTVPAGTGNQFIKTTCPTTLGNNTYSMTCPDPYACIWNTVIAYNSAVKEISILNGSADGFTIGDWTTNTGVATCGTTGAPCPWDPLPVITAFTPVLAIIQVMENDCGAGTPIATYKAGLTSMAEAVQAGGGDVLFITGMPETEAVSGGIDICAPYAAAMVSVANTLGVPVWDVYTTLGGANWPNTPYFLNAAGMQCCGTAWDNEHFSIGLYMWQASFVMQILLL